MSSGFVYILQEREFVRSNEDIYLVKDTKSNTDISKLVTPKNSKIWAFCPCNNHKVMKIEIIKLFKQKYKLRSDIGQGYFEGNPYEMSVDICDILKTNHSKFDIYIDKFSIFRHTFGISDIIITDKTSKEGHILFDDATEWSININIKEYLLHKKIEINNDILQELCDEHFVEEPCYYKLQYNEYFVTKDKKQACIINTKNLTIDKYTPSREKILNSHQKSPFQIPISSFNEIDTSIVDNTLSKLISNKEIIKEYKKLCYNVLVHQTEDTIIVYDDSSYLSMWLIYLLDILNPGLLYYKIDTYDYHDTYIEVLGNMNKKESQTRLVYIQNTKKLSKKIEHIKQCGIKNIIVQGYMSDKDKFDFVQYVKSNQVIYNMVVEKYILEIDEINIFGNPKLLLRNFLKWCCTP
jgi:hypothetical protein